MTTRPLSGRLDRANPAVLSWGRGFLRRYPERIAQRLTPTPRTWWLLVGANGRIEVGDAQAGTPEGGASPTLDERVARKASEREVRRQLFELEQVARSRTTIGDARVLNDFSLETARERWAWAVDGPVHRLILDGYELAWLVMVGRHFRTGACAEFSNTWRCGGIGTLEEAMRCVEEDLAAEWYGVDADADYRVTVTSKLKGAGE